MEYEIFYLHKGNSLFNKVFLNDPARKGKVAIGLLAGVLLGIVLLLVLVFRGWRGEEVPVRRYPKNPGGRAPALKGKKLEAVGNKEKGEKLLRKSPAPEKGSPPGKNAPSLTVEVVRRVSKGAPGEKWMGVPGALLWLVDPEKPPSAGKFRAVWGEESFFFSEVTKYIQGGPFKILDPAGLVRLGSCQRADERGRVKVRPPRGRAFLLVARKGEDWGTALLENPPGPVYRLAIAPERVLRVKVVGSRGEPCPGVPVVLEIARRDTGEGTALPSPGVTHLPEWKRWNASVTGPDGLCVFKGYLAWAKVFCPEGRGEWSGSVHAEILQKENVRNVSFDPLDPPSAPVVLRIPPAGSLKVRVRFPRGFSWKGKGLVWLECREVKPPHSAFGPRRIFMPVVRAGRDAGTALFPFLNLGLKLDLTFQWTDPSGLVVVEKKVERVEGPFRPGESVERVIELGAFSPRVHLKLVGPNGRALAGRKVWLWGAFPALEVVTGPDGGLSLPYHFLRGGLEGREGGKPGGRADSFCAQVLTTGEVRPWGRLMGKFQVPAGLEKDYSAGVILLRRAQLVLAGKVVDAFGNPLAGAQVGLQKPGKVGGGEGPTGGGGLFELPFTIDFSKEDGSFSFFGRVRLSRVKLTVWRPPYFLFRKVMETGKKDLRLVLEGGGTILAQMVPPEGVDSAGELGAMVVPSGWSGKDGFPPFFDMWVAYKKGNELRLDHVPAGKVDFLVTPKVGPSFLPSATGSPGGTGSTGPGGGGMEAGGVLCRVPGIEVREGRTTRDPRLLPLDLRGKVQKVRIDLVDEGGAPVEKRAKIEVSGFGTFYLSGKRVELVAPKRPLELEISVEGFKPKALHQVVGKRVAVLSKS